MELNSLNLTLPDSVVDYYMPDTDAVTHEGSGYVRGELDNPEAFRSLGVSREFPSELWIEPREWQEFAEKVDKARMWGSSLRPRFTHQGNSHECTSHSIIYNWEIAYMRLVLALEEAIFLSPLSLYCRVNPGQWGGATIFGVLEEFVNRGALPDKIGPKGIDQSARFAHTLHGTAGGRASDDMTAGRWVTERDFAPDWEDTGILLRPDEVIVPDTWEQAVCLLLHGYGSCVGRDGHAICYNQIGWRAGDPPERPMGLYSDSYVIDRVDAHDRFRRALSYGSYTIATPKLLPDNLVVAA